MNLSLIVPPEVFAWFTRYGMFCAVLFIAVLISALVMRPFWLWYTGRAEELHRLRRLEEDTRKSLFELEMLNHTLAIPVKKAAQKAKTAEKADEAMVVSETTKADFLKALEKSRARIQDEASNE